MPMVCRVAHRAEAGGIRLLVRRRLQRATLGARQGTIAIHPYAFPEEPYWLGPVTVQRDLLDGPKGGIHHHEALLNRITYSVRPIVSPYPFARSGSSGSTAWSLDGCREQGTPFGSIELGPRQARPVRAVAAYRSSNDIAVSVDLPRAGHATGLPGANCPNCESQAR